MKPLERSFNDDLMRRFLIGEVDEGEREAIERRFMEDDAYFESICALEREMMVDLVQGRLPARWAVPFEKALAASPDRQRRLEEVRLLTAAVTREAPRSFSRRVPAAWLAAAAAVVVLAGALAVWNSQPLPGSPGPAPQPPAPSPAVVATAFLRPGPFRSPGEKLNSVEVATGVVHLRLVAILEAAPGAPVEARVRPVGGDVIEIPPATESRATTEGLEVSWELPASALAAGDYLIAYSRRDAGSVVTIGTRFVRITKGAPSPATTPGR